MDRITPEHLAQLASQHGRVEVVTSKARTTRKGVEIPAGTDWECVFRKPSPQEYRAFRADTVHDIRGPEAQEILVRKTVVYPDRAAFDKLLDQFPGVPAAAAAAIKRLCGLIIEQPPEMSLSKLTEDQLDEWESKYRFISHIMGVGGAWEVVYRIPSRMDLKAFRGRAHDSKIQSEAIEVLARQCAIYPPKEAFDSLLKEYPGIPEASVQSFMDLAQVEAEESGNG